MSEDLYAKIYSCKPQLPTWIPNGCWLVQLNPGHQVSVPPPQKQFLNVWWNVSRWSCFGIRDISNKWSEHRLSTKGNLSFVDNLCSTNKLKSTWNKINQQESYGSFCKVDGATGSPQQEGSTSSTSVTRLRRLFTLRETQTAEKIQSWTRDQRPETRGTSPSWADQRWRPCWPWFCSTCLWRPDYTMVSLCFCFSGFFLNICLSLTLRWNRKLCLLQF